jgi:DNA-binding MarR family transcriptional regulator
MTDQRSNGEGHSRKLGVAGMTERNVDPGAGAAGQTDIDYGLLETAVGYRMRRVQVGLLADFNERLSVKDVRSTDFTVLTIIAANPGLKQSEVAEALGIQRANFVAVIDALEKSGFAERRKSDFDRRVQSLHITPAGAAHLAEITAIWRAHEDEIVARLGGAAARDQLIRLLALLNP